MMLHYNIPDFSDTAEFLNLLARRMGKLKKGGVPDLARAARRVLQDWNRFESKYIFLQLYFFTPSPVILFLKSRRSCFSENYPSPSLMVFKHID